ncbi:hypothetical protein [Streptomyces hesseae]|uniref:Uncharacterized protein n=1 Tax=Streptomyces hesseae TaxID=3075519 RepID=A0ABU2SYI6_9ACTN|nr:hypothetical protein [Streptomyces sp. DSM 40473]MDT0452984.1 hypothetical protein [Streptomyces sp. DSM 40473]
MINKENRLNSPKGEGLVKGSTAGIGEMLGKMLLGWRSLFLGCAGTAAGFIGAFTNSGLTTRAALLAIGVASFALAWVTLRHMKGQRNARNGPER